jgi:hypothetical protein
VPRPPAAPGLVSWLSGREDDGCYLQLPAAACGLLTPAMECSGPREQHTPFGGVAVPPPPLVPDGSSGDGGGLLGLLPANTAHDATEHLRFPLQARRAQDPAGFLGGLQQVPNDSGFDDDSVELDQSSVDLVSMDLAVSKVRTRSVRS